LITIASLSGDIKQQEEIEKKLDVKLSQISQAKIRIVPSFFKNLPQDVRKVEIKIYFDFDRAKISHIFLNLAITGVSGCCSGDQDPATGGQVIDSFESCVAAGKPSSPATNHSPFGLGFVAAPSDSNLS